MRQKGSLEDGGDNGKGTAETFEMYGVRGAALQLLLAFTVIYINHPVVQHRPAFFRQHISLPPCISLPHHQAGGLSFEESGLDVVELHEGRKESEGREEGR